MAKISQTAITLELETLSCDDVGDGIVMLDITVEEAIDLMNLLKERFGENTVGVSRDDPLGVLSGWEAQEETNWELSYSNLYHKVGDMVYQCNSQNRWNIDPKDIAARWDKIRSNLPDPKL